MLREMGDNKQYWQTARWRAAAGRGARRPGSGAPTRTTAASGAWPGSGSGERGRTGTSTTGHPRNGDTLHIICHSHSSLQVLNIK